ncbi:MULTISPECIES: 5-deoxy-glucuronate isomerase [unclassified Bacillus (in: firmicutes)]|uniref:5-deoxy-glucuronate isomerase n=1 Tax=Bacillus TaxID=1386 RepID=UPI00338F69E0
MANLIVPKQKRDKEGKVISITPQSAGWTYIGFDVYTLQKGETVRKETGEKEVCIVILSGKLHLSTKNKAWDEIGERMNVFEKIPPFSVYVPNDDYYEMKAITDSEIAICAAPGKGTYPARLIAPEQVSVEHRGAGNIARQVHNILPEQEPADHLLVVEVFTPEGNWSSYPPHKHDQNNLPHESYLEETYYHKVKPQQGFVLQRVYTDDLSLDETMAVTDSTAVLVPKGYHPVSAPPGYEIYYLNVMAGPVRTWKFHNSTEHEWVMENKLKVNKEGS